MVDDSEGGKLNAASRHDTFSARINKDKLTSHSGWPSTNWDAVLKSDGSSTQSK